MAPLAIAYEKGYFEDEGLYVTLEPQANWKVILDRVITGELDGAHMLAGQPLGAAVGIGTKADVVTGFSMDLNGNAHHGFQRSLGAHEGRPCHRRKGPAQASDHRRRRSSPRWKNSRLRASRSRWPWCSPCPLTTTSCATGSRPAASIPGSIRRPTSPGQIARRRADLGHSAAADAGHARGRNDQRLLVGEPWNQQAIFKGVGVPVITDYEIWKNNPEKVFGVTKAFADKNPNTHIALIKALIARRHLARRQERRQPQGGRADPLASRICGRRLSRDRQQHDRHLRVRPRRQARGCPTSTCSSRYHANYPFYQRCRLVPDADAPLGPDPESKPDAWYLETAKKVYRADIFLQAAKVLIAEKEGQGGGLRLRDATAFARRRRISSMASNTTAASPMPTSRSSRIGLKGQQKIEGGNVVGK